MRPPYSATAVAAFSVGLARSLLPAHVTVYSLCSPLPLAALAPGFPPWRITAGSHASVMGVGNEREIQLVRSVEPPLGQAAAPDNGTNCQRWPENPASRVQKGYVGEHSPAGNRSPLAACAVRSARISRALLGSLAPTVTRALPTGRDRASLLPSPAARRNQRLRHPFVAHGTQ